MVCVFSRRITAILVSRFLLDLQEAYQRKFICLSSSCPFDTSHDVSAGSAIFAPVLGVLSVTVDGGGRQDAECEEYTQHNASGDRHSEDAFAEGPTPKNRSHGEQIPESLGAQLPAA